MKTRIPKRLPLQAHPTSAEREYYRHLKRYADKYCVLMRGGLDRIVPHLQDVAEEEMPRADSIYQKLVDTRMDANIEKRVQDLMEWVDAELARAFPDKILQGWARSMIGQVNRNAKNNITKMGKAVGLEVEPLMHDRGLSPWFQNAIDENIGLIKSIPKMHQASFKNALVSLITGDATTDTIRKAIMAHIGAKGNVPARAALIAADQVGKLNGIINEYRQRQLGGRRYIWRGSKDERERDDHWKLEGTTQRWDSPPITNRRTNARNHPGRDFRCRCRAEMVLEDVLE